MAGPPFTFHLSAGEACDILGISPYSPAPDYAVMRSYMRRLQMLLHPDHVVSGGNAARAQQELGFSFVALREVEEWLFTKPAADEYPKRISQLFNAAKALGSLWISHWNPHKLDGGDMFSPLPAWPHRESKPTATRSSNANSKAPGSSSSSSTTSSGTSRTSPSPNAGSSNSTSNSTSTHNNNNNNNPIGTD
ncbi:hypothetical protein SLS58_011070 [Diplodia intermedia]|uniref:J domain-containing protein n=1 Tax=Diplodia intermedia TaxID=856260 RepID=A0ABR3T1L0_9PEZI